MRKIILDTETTGLDYNDDRIIEIACLEIIDDSFTGKKYHQYFNPGDIIISKQAEQIHGLNNQFLNKYKTFDQSLNEFIEFIDGSPLIIHNAQFDLSMINSALKREKRSLISRDTSICTLEMAKKKFPGSKNNLNALCRRFNIGLESREKHGALTDCFLLLRVFIELIGGRQEKLNFLINQAKESEETKKVKRDPLLIPVSKEEETLHLEMLRDIPNPIWKMN